MQYWLVKSDPDDYSCADLQRDRRTLWTGVRNPQAQIYLRAMAAGDSVLIYHTGAEKAVVGLARVMSAPQPDPSAAAGKRVAVELAFGAWFPRAVALAELRGAGKRFGDFLLLKNSRLSVMPVSPAHFDALRKLANKSAESH